MAKTHDVPIVITYPPDFDGELHVKSIVRCDQERHTAEVEFHFTYAVPPHARTSGAQNMARASLVHAAQDIIAEDSRRRGGKS